MRMTLLQATLDGTLRDEDAAEGERTVYSSPVGATQTFSNVPLTQLPRHAPPATEGDAALPGPSGAVAAGAQMLAQALGDAPRQPTPSASMATTVASSHKRRRLDSEGPARKALDSAYVRMLYVQDPKREGMMLVEEEEVGEGRVRKYVTCRICSKHYSFNKGSYTAVTNHLMSHNVTTLARIEEAVAWADKANAEGLPFPVEKLAGWLPAAAVCERGSGGARGPSTSGAGVAEQVAMMRRFAKPPQHAIRSQAWHWALTATTKWIVTDCLPFSTVESEAFRSFARHLESRFPDFSRKAVVSEVSVRTCGSVLLLMHVFLFHMHANKHALLPLSQTKRLHACAVDRLKREEDWPVVRPSFSADLWRSRTRTEYFTLTMHWVHQRTEPTGRVTWVLKRRVLASVAVHEETIDAQGETCMGAVSLRWGMQRICKLAKKDYRKHANLDAAVVGVVQ